MNEHSPSFQTPFSAEIKALGVDPIPAGPYYDAAYFELEREAVFKRSWLQIGHVCELPEPGSFFVRELEFAKASLLVTRGKDGAIRAFHNVCTHRGTQLVAEAAGKRSSFTCRYHAWTFGNDGALRSAPDLERFYVEAQDCGLQKVAVDTCAGLIFVNLDPTPKQGLREFLGPMAEMIETLPVAQATNFDEYVYEIDASWKITFDNFQENYHVRFVHSHVSGKPPPDAVNPFTYPVDYQVYGPHRMYTNMGGAPHDNRPRPVLSYLLGKMGAQLMADGLATGPHANDYFIFFPNLYLHGSPGMHFTHLVTPLSAGRSRGVFRFYWVGDDRSATDRLVREFSMAFGREIHAEDGDVLRAAQRGLASGALKHVHFQQQEVMCRHLYESVDRMVRDYIVEQKGERSAS